MVVDNNAHPSSEKDKDLHLPPNSKYPIDLWAYSMHRVAIAMLQQQQQ